MRYLAAAKCKLGGCFYVAGEGFVANTTPSPLMDTPLPAAPIEEDKMVITLKGKTVELDKDEVFKDPRAAAIRWLENYRKEQEEAEHKKSPTRLSGAFRVAIRLSKSAATVQRNGSKHIV